MQAYEILHAGYVIAPLVAGFDKFTNRLVDWEQYIAPQVADRLGVTPRTFAKLAGVIEMAAGIGVAVKPKIFGYVVSGWLFGIVGNLALRRKYYDVALRDVGLALGALALGRLSHMHEGSIRQALRENIASRRERAASAEVEQPSEISKAA
jgi:hypothetical protein